MTRLIDILGIPTEAFGRCPNMNEDAAPRAHDRSESHRRGRRRSGFRRRWFHLLHVGDSRSRAGARSLWDEHHSRLFSGDHLLPSITPNPLIEPDPSSLLGRRRSLVEYLESLQRFECRAPTRCSPVTARRSGTCRSWRARPGPITKTGPWKFIEEIRELGAPSAYELSCKVFPDVEAHAVSSRSPRSSAMSTCWSTPVKSSRTTAARPATTCVELSLRTRMIADPQSVERRVCSGTVFAARLAGLGRPVQPV